MKARHQFGISVQRGPCPHVAKVTATAECRVNLPLLHADEAPYLVALEPLARQVNKVLLLIGEAGRAHFFEKLDYGVLRRSSHAHRSTNGVALNQSGEDGYPATFA